MNKKTAVISAVVVAALGGGGAAIATAAGTGGSEKGKEDSSAEKPITGPALKRASDIALAKVPGSKVTQTEAGDEEGAYEVEVTKPDGTEADVRLDAQFKVIAVEIDKPDGAEGADTADSASTP